jgi:TolB-like protein
MSFFEELKRRNVFKVGIAYAVGGWLLLQMTEVLSELLKLPDTVGPIVVSIVVIGLPITIFIAWAFEMTPEGIKREAEVDRSQSITPRTGKKLNNTILAMMALAIVYLLYDKFSVDPPDTESTNQIVQNSGSATSTTPESETIPAINPKSIAVLPFDNRSRNVDDEFFVEGIHDDLLTNLARIGSLKVISRTSVSKYKETDKTIPEIAAELGVATVMEGAVQRSGDTIRINVQLIDAVTDEHLWAEIFDREMTANNLFAIQTEISEKIAEALKTTLSPEEQERISGRPTENLAAYNAYLRGRQHLPKRTAEDLGKALEEFQRAVDLDPEFALAWVGVAESAGLLASYSSFDLLESIEIREQAVAKAMALNDQLGEAHLSQAMLHSFNERLDEAETSFKKAIELSPNYATAYQWYGDFVARWPARARESLRLTEQAVSLDPLSSILRYEIAEKLIFLGRFEAAEAKVRELIEMDPDFPVAQIGLTNIYSQTGQFDKAVLSYRQLLALNPGDIGTYSDLAFTMLDLGNAEAIAGIRKTMEDIDDEHFSLGILSMFESMYKQNWTAALETGEWVNQQIGRQPFFQQFIGFLHLMNGDYQKSKDAFELQDASLFDPATFREGIERLNTQGCIVGYVMMRTGEEAKGRQLIDMTLNYVENELPTYVDHADRFGLENCYLVNGDYEKALTAIETSFEHGHINGWWIQTRFPWYEPIRGEPRYEAAMQSVRDRMAIQRENLARIDAEAGP